MVLGSRAQDFEFSIDVGRSMFDFHFYMGSEGGDQVSEVQGVRISSSVLKLP